MAGLAVFAVIDTETNWRDQVMSIGTVAADSETFAVLDAKYHVLVPETAVGGMYEGVLFLEEAGQPILTTRKQAMAELTTWLRQLGVEDIYAYNAAFDRNHMPEFSHLRWHDILRLAAYRQYNPAIPRRAECFSTGRLKRGYGVEPMLRLLSGDGTYRETHNAILDARDELQIMRLLGYPIGAYPVL